MAVCGHCCHGCLVRDLILTTNGEKEQIGTEKGVLEMLTAGGLEKHPTFCSHRKIGRGTVCIPGLEGTQPMVNDGNNTVPASPSNVTLIYRKHHFQKNQHPLPSASPQPPAQKKTHIALRTLKTRTIETQRKRLAHLDDRTTTCLYTRTLTEGQSWQGRRLRA